MDFEELVHGGGGDDDSKTVRSRGDHRSTSSDNSSSSNNNNNNNNIINDRRSRASSSSLFSSIPTPAPNSLSYYGLCVVGGGLSSSIRWMLTPIDLVKVNLQAYPKLWATPGGGGGVRQGLTSIWTHEGIKGLYRGLMPTVLAYGTQSSVKYGTYEYLKHQLWTEEEEAPCGVGAIDNDSDNPVPALPLIKSKTAVYILSAAIAEGIADVLMCPWEMLKVKIQTAPTPATAMATAAGPASGSSHASSFPTRFGPAFWMMVQQRHQTGWPFGAIVPLWGRQVIGTVANFVTFEHVANLMYDHLLLSTEPSQEYRSPLLPKRTKSDLSQLTQLGVTFTAGYVSGIISTVVSHPADTLVSLQARYPTLTMREIIGRVGIYQLATKGLGLRIVKTGTIIAAQWLIYDSFKSALGMGTTGGGGGNDM